MTYSTPLTAKNLDLSNRLVMPPMATGAAGVDGAITEKHLEYYEERAKESKIGLIIIEHCYINVQGRAKLGQIAIGKDADIEGLRKLVDVIHKYDVKVIAQLNHAGSAAPVPENGMPAVGPSAVLRPRAKAGEELPEALTHEQIDEIRADFVTASLNAKEAGFDGVEIHSAHGYLLNQFYSPLTNKRTDEYGRQNIENAVRFQLEVLDAVRNTVGSDYTVAIRLGGCDYLEGGSTIEDAAEACRMFEKAGADLIDLTGGMNGYVRPDNSEPGYFKDMSFAVKKAVSVPVLLTGGVKTLEEADALLSEGAADLIGIGRAIYADAHWYR